MSSAQNVNGMDSFNNDMQWLQEIDRFVAKGLNKVLAGRRHQRRLHRLSPMQTDMTHADDGVFIIVNKHRAGIMVKVGLNILIKRLSHSAVIDPTTTAQSAACRG